MSGPLGHTAKWYAVKDSESYSSVRYKATLHESLGEQECWIATQLSHGNAQRIADDHNCGFSPRIPDAPEGYRYELVRLATTRDAAPQVGHATPYAAEGHRGSHPVVALDGAPAEAAPSATFIETGVKDAD